jgi:hypothetical protein
LRGKDIAPQGLGFSISIFIYIGNKKETQKRENKVRKKKNKICRKFVNIYLQRVFLKRENKVSILAQTQYSKV